MLVKFRKNNIFCVNQETFSRPSLGVGGGSAFLASRSASVGTGIPAGGFEFCSGNEKCSVGREGAGDDQGGEDRAREGGAAAPGVRGGAWENQQGPARGTAFPRASAWRGRGEADEQA